jgi:hypothetical protein
MTDLLSDNDIPDWTEVTYVSEQVLPIFQSIQAWRGICFLWRFGWCADAESGAGDGEFLAFCLLNSPNNFGTNTKGLVFDRE